MTVISFVVFNSILFELGIYTTKDKEAMYHTEPHKVMIIKLYILKTEINTISYAVFN